MLVYDIKLNNGQILKGCYCIKYEKPVHGGNGNVLMLYMFSHISYFIKDKEIKDIDFTNASIIKIYDELTNIDFTEKLINNYKEASKILGYYPEFPIPRQTIRL